MYYNIYRDCVPDYLIHKIALHHYFANDDSPTDIVTQDQTHSFRHGGHLRHSRLSETPKADEYQAFLLIGECTSITTVYSYYYYDNIFLSACQINI